MTLELHIANVSENREFIFPLTPAKLPVQRQSTMLPFKVLDFGDFQFQRGIGPHQITIQGRLVGSRSRPHHSTQATFWEPARIIAALENSQETRTILHVYMPDTPLDYQMQIANVGWSIEAGAWAGDLMLDSFQLVEVSDRYLQARPADLVSSWPDTPPEDVAAVEGETGSDPNDPIEDEADGNRSDPGPPATYTVKSGDSLWRIAVELWRDGSRWVDLYTANQELIDAQNGGVGPDLIYPGQILTVPGSTQAPEEAEQVLVDIEWVEPLPDLGV